MVEAYPRLRFHFYGSTCRGPLLASMTKILRLAKPCTPRRKTGGCARKRKIFCHALLQLTEKIVWWSLIICRFERDERCLLFPETFFRQLLFEIVKLIHQTPWPSFFERIHSSSVNLLRSACFLQFSVFSFGGLSISTNFSPSTANMCRMFTENVLNYHTWIE